MVIVFGSINVDLVSRVERFPAPGETVSGASFQIYPGGKGGNQALAAARAGAEVRLYGAVGSDALAAAALFALEHADVELEGVARVNVPTGCATILVDAGGENCIVVVAGANAFADPAAVPDAVLGRASTLVLQQEVPEAANAALVARARQRGARIVLNAAPGHPAPLEVLRQLDVLVVNEIEAVALAAPLGWPAAAEEFATAASASASLTAIVTLGDRGAIVVRERKTLRVAAPAVEVFDTTGAGDAFVGTLAAALDAGAALADAMRRAVQAGSLACTREGARKPCGVLAC